MNAGPVRSGGILAAGDGSRLLAGGWTMAKPLVPVEGVALVERTIRNFRSAGIERLSIIFNEREEDCARFVESRFPGADIRILLKTTASSYESYREISRMLPPGPALVSTVDAWCAPGAFARFASEAAQAPAGAVVLAVTPLVRDEKPLWVRLDASSRVTRLGGNSGDCVTAGLYVFPERVRNLEPPPAFGRLREYLAWLVESGENVVAVPIGAVVDVDTAEDVALAETLSAAGPNPSARAGVKP